MEIDADKIYKFANRLRYSPSDNLPDNIIVDHVNKEYNTKAFSYDVLFDIIFWNTPKFVYNVVKSSLKHTFGYSMTLSNIFSAINELDLELDTTRYRNNNLHKLLHPCIDSTLRTDFKKVINIILCKAFDEEDSYFNVCCPVISNNNISNLLTLNEHLFLNIINNIDAILSGSFAMSMYGFVYRKTIKDFDLLVDYKYLPNDILEIINDELTYNKIVGKDRIKTQEEVYRRFIDCEFFDILNRIFYNKLEVKAAVIDVVAEYDNITKITFILKYDDIEFDLIFRGNLKYKTFSIPLYNEFGKVIYENTSKVQDINEILFTKRLLGRPKDFQDLINFKPYTRLNNNGKCVVNYEANLENCTLVKDSIE